MILYFSGTGNSEYVALRIAQSLGDETQNLFTKIKDNDHSRLNSTRPWIVVTPTYGWRLPRLIDSWLQKTDLVGNSDIFFVLTCGGSVGNAGKYLEKLCRSKNMNFRGLAAVIMPENYIAMFETVSQKEALEIIESSENKIDEIIGKLRADQNLPQMPASFRDRLSSGIINSLFYSLFVHAKKFYATDACVSCGRCVEVCPLNNINLKEGHPLWGDKCTHCMACINRCPTKAIEYGNHTKGLKRYVCPKHLEQ